MQKLTVFVASFSLMMSPLVEAGPQADYDKSDVQFWLSQGGKLGGAGAVSFAIGTGLRTEELVITGLAMMIAGGASGSMAGTLYWNLKELEKLSAEQVQEIQVALVDQATLVKENPDIAQDLALHQSTHWLEGDLEPLERTQLLAEIVLSASSVEDPESYVGENPEKSVDGLLPEEYRSKEIQRVMKNALVLFQMG